MRKIFKVVKNKEFQKKLWFTLFLLSIYEFGSMITLPGINQESLVSQDGSSFISIINMIGGGSLDKMSLFALGVTPYITASIVIQLMSSDVIPYLSNLREQGVKGQVKLDRITRIFAIILSFIQAYGFCMMYGTTVSIENGVVSTGSVFLQSGMTPIFTTCLLMMTGTMIAIWFGDLLTMHGLGNGVSMIICSGILMRLPLQMASIFTSLVEKQNYTWFALYLLSVLFLIIFVIVLQEAERRIPIWDPSAQGMIDQENTNYLPLKVNTPGVMPIIFASSLMAVPMQLLGVFGKDEWVTKVSAFLGMQTWYSIMIYAMLIIFFSFFYTKIQVDPKKVSESLTKRNCFIPDIQPGKETEIYINKTLNHIMIYGALGLMMVGIVPHVLPMFTPLSSSTAIGGTSILIIIGVLVELYSQMKNLIHKDRYEQFRPQPLD